jgi:transcriptional regulator with XRE-family HTH domain
MTDKGPFNKLIAARVERLRRARSLSIDDLAERALLEPAQVEAILAGTEALGLDTVILLAGALGVETRELLEGVEWPPSA